MRVHGVGQPDRVRLPTGEDPALGEQLEGALVAEPACQQPARADLGHQADLSECGDDPRAFRGQDQVAGKRERQAHARGGAVHGGDERLVGAGDQAGDAAELHPDPAPDGGRAALALVDHG